ncbi:hypothetical protein ACGFMK_18555 [Amycolatopsis sp. NPDC049252]|uniref:hypothetical protein n=1 Tax=Amycolatopsis sp. NPDC049252 TaxID=3363933 RepID=UPI0037178AF5
MLRTGVLAASTLALGLAFVPVASADPVQTVAYTSADGAWPLQGSASYRGPGDEIRVWVNDDVLKIDVQSGFHDLRVELSAPAGETLHPGAYPGARFRLSSEPATATPGFLTVTGNFGCGDDYADFTIDRLDQSADGTVAALDATFVQHCGTPDGPATHGEVHFTA